MKKLLFFVIGLLLFIAANIIAVEVGAKVFSLSFVLAYFGVKCVNFDGD